MPENVAAVLLIVSLIAPIAALFAGLLFVAMPTTRAKAAPRAREASAHR